MTRLLLILAVFRERGLEPEEGDAIRSILHDYARVKEENERLREQLQYPDPEDMPVELAAKYCPFNDPFHFHHDGCPSEWAQEERAEKAEAELRELRAFVKMALLELGVPNDNYPSPIGNAVSYLNSALAPRGGK